MTIKQIFGFSFALASLFIAGCSTQQKLPKATDESSNFTEVNYLTPCILPNPEVPNSKIASAIFEGFKTLNATPKMLNVDDGPQACEFVVTYSIHSTGKVIDGLKFQTFEHGIPRVSATGKAKNGALTVDNVINFSKELLDTLIQKAQKENKPKSFKTN